MQTKKGYSLKVTYSATKLHLQLHKPETLNPKPLNPKSLNTKSLNPKSLDPKTLNPKP